MKLVFFFCLKRRKCMRLIGNKPLIYMEISDNSKHKNFSRQAYSFLKVKLRRLRRKMYEGKYDTCDKNLSTVLANSSMTAGTGVMIENARKRNTFTVIVISCPPKANIWRFKNISCNRNEPNYMANCRGVKF